MQTFLPYDDFFKSCSVLDYRRLGKQRVEAMQIYNIITGKNVSKWKNHPAVKMWTGYSDALALYHNTVITEWKRRGYKNNMKLLKIDKVFEEPLYPWWFGNEDFHRCYRAKLLEKNENYYSKYFIDDKNFNDNEYLWADNDTKTFKIIKSIKKKPKK